MAGPHQLHTKCVAELPSDQAMTLLIDMLQTNPSNRPTVHECLVNCWVLKGSQDDKLPESDNSTDISTTIDGSSESSGSPHITDIGCLDDLHDDITLDFR